MTKKRKKNTIKIYIEENIKIISNSKYLQNYNSTLLIALLLYKVIQ